MPWVSVPRISVKTISSATLTASASDIPAAVKARMMKRRASSGMTKRVSACGMTISFLCAIEPVRWLADRACYAQPGSSGLGNAVETNIERSCAEPGLAISEIILPHATEPRIEAEFGDPGPRDLKTLRPFGERAGIARSEMLDMLQNQPRALHMALDQRRCQQHAAGKDIALDKVRVAAVTLEARLIDRDGLEDRDPAAPQAVAQDAEIACPIIGANGLDHLDGDDAVEQPVDVAIILESQGSRAVM